LVPILPFQIPIGEEIDFHIDHDRGTGSYVVWFIFYSTFVFVENDLYTLGLIEDWITRLAFNQIPESFGSKSRPRWLLYSLQQEVKFVYFGNVRISGYHSGLASCLEKNKPLFNMMCLQSLLTLRKKYDHYTCTDIILFHIRSLFVFVLSIEIKTLI